MTLSSSKKVNITKYLPILIPILLVTTLLIWFYFKNITGHEVPVSYPLEKLIVNDDSLSVDVSNNAGLEDLIESDIVRMLQNRIEKDISKEGYKEPDNYTFNDKGGCDEYWYPDYRMDECINHDGSGIYRILYPYNTTIFDLFSFDLKVDLSDMILSERYHIYIDGLDEFYKVEMQGMRVVSIMVLNLDR